MCIIEHERRDQGILYVKAFIQKDSRNMQYLLLTTLTRMQSMNNKLKNYNYIKDSFTVDPNPLLAPPPLC